MTSLRTCGIGGNSLCFRENLVRRDRRGGGPMLGSLNRGAQGCAQRCWKLASCMARGQDWGPVSGTGWLPGLRLGTSPRSPPWGPTRGPYLGTHLAVGRAAGVLGPLTSTYT